MDVKQQCLDTIGKYQMFQKGDKVVVGVSGGADSVCLLHLLKTLREELDLKLYVAHLDHMFRGEESRRDARFVESLCHRWYIPFYECRVDVPRIIKTTGFSPEDAARRARHEFFQRIRGQVGAEKIATGHNQDDHEETLLMNILRGTGLEGLLGIEPLRECYVRPLIEIPRRAIEGYIREHHLEIRTDSTNLSPDYFRNSLRLQLIPHIQQRFCPHLGDSLRRLSEITRVELDFIKPFEQEAWDKVATVDAGRIAINKEAFTQIHPALKHRVLRRALKNIAGDLKDFEYRHALLTTKFIADATAGSQIHLPRGIVGEMGYGFFSLHKGKTKKISDYHYEIEVPGKVFIEELGIEVRARVGPKPKLIITTNPLIAQLDYDKIKATLIVRNRRSGDRFTPFGASYTKKLKDFMMDEKVPQSQRDRVPIFESGGQIVWVGGLRVDDNFKITEKTKTVLFLEIKKENGQ